MAPPSTSSNKRADRTHLDDDLDDDLDHGDVTNNKTNRRDFAGFDEADARQHPDIVTAMPVVRFCPKTNDVLRMRVAKDTRKLELFCTTCGHSELVPPHLSCVFAATVVPPRTL